jgi:ATP-dependent Clp protease adaptor protein ClpS
MAGPAVLPEPRTAPPEVRPAPRWHVVLHDSPDHSFEYVTLMLMQLFGHDVERAFRHAVEVDATGRTIVDTTHRERAELKAEQIRTRGPDPLIPRCKGSMHATIEPDRDG